MNTVRRRGATALTAAIALALGGIPAAFTTSSILAAGEGTTTLDAGAVDVESMVFKANGSQGAVTWNGITETFTGGQQCEIIWAGGAPTLMELSGSTRDGSPAVAGFRDGQIGVFEPSGDGTPTNASQCFRIDSDSFELSEVLTVGLGSNPALLESFGNTQSPILATSADVRYKINSQRGAFTFGAGTTTQKEEWGNTGKRPKPGTEFTATFAMPENSNFSSLTLASESGSFSVVEVILHLESQRDATICNEGNLAGPYQYRDGTTTVSYLGDADGTDSCFGVKLTSGGREYTWLKPLTVSPDAQFVFEQTWTLDSPPTPAFTLPVATIDFELELPDPDGEGTIPSGEEPLLFCPDFLYPEGDPARELALITDADTLEALDEEYDMVDDVPGVDGSQGTQFSCIDKKSRTTRIELPTSDDPGGLKVEDKIFLIGDAKYRF